MSLFLMGPDFTALMMIRHAPLLPIFINITLDVAWSMLGTIDLEIIHAADIRSLVTCHIIIIP